MLAGMGGVSYHAVVAAVSDAGGFGTLGAATMSSEQLDDGDGGRAGRDRQAVRRRPPRRAARTHARRRAQGRDRRRVVVRRRARRAARRREDPPRRQRARREHVRQGAARDRGGRGRVRLRDRAGHRGGRSHRHGRDDAARAADRRRGRQPRPRGRGRRHLRRARPRGRDQPRRRRRVDRHALHRDARGAHGARATRTRCCAHRKTER